jgi:RNA polymerase sigma-70 factor (ECF subfamily)
MAVNAANLKPNQMFESGSTASDLLAAAKRLDAGAWRDLVERYSWLIVRWCQKEGLPADDAPDVLQAVLLQVAGNLAHFEKDGRTAAFRRWLRAITRSQVAEFRRAAGNQPRGRGGTSAQQHILDVPDRDPEPAFDPRPERLLERFWDLIERLEESFEPATWQAFWLTTFESLTSVEAAVCLNMTPAAVRLAKARVLRRIREEHVSLASEFNTLQG